MTNTGEDIVSVALYALMIAIFVALYFLPSIVGWRRHIRNIRPLVVLNLLGGWCLLAWVGALVVAIRNPTREART